MTPQEKARELINKFPENLIEDDEVAKKCTLILIDEILYALPPFEHGLECVAKIDYWLKVKKEAEKL